MGKSSHPSFAELIKDDAKYIWHPYTQALTANQPIPISQAKDEYLIGYDGVSYFDAISSWGVNIHGHCHPYIAEKISEEVYKLDHSIFADFTHKPAIELAKRLLDLLKIDGKVFFSDNGSTAVETALKIALQYWHNQSIKRTKIICFENAYHGETFGAMSLSGDGTFTTPFRPYLFSIETIPPPYPGKEQASLNRLQTLLEKKDAACFIFEPILQAVSGMTVHSSTALEKMLTLCHENGLITIADEIMTGFGRTGPLFACDRFKLKPDIFCLSKGLTGGFLPLAATICKERIYEVFLSKDRAKAFLHGHSYCGNPLGCVAALANLDLFESEESALQRRRIENSHLAFRDTCKGYKKVKRCEVIGTILIVEYDDRQKGSYFSPIRDYLVTTFLKNHILVRPLGNILYLMPPYCTEKRILEKTYHCIIDTLKE